MAKSRMKAFVIRWTRRVGFIVLLALVTIAGVRMYDAQRKPPLGPWHTYVPEEMHAHALDQATWDDYIARENRLFDSVRRHVTDQLTSDERVAANRYFDGSPVYPGHFRTDWNRSYTLVPEGTIAGEGKTRRVLRRYDRARR